MSDLTAVPNPVIHSCQILDPGADVRRIEVVSEVLKRGRQMSYSRSKIVDADNPSRVLALTEGQGVAIGLPPEGLEKMDTAIIEVVDSPDLPPLWEVFGAQRREDGQWALPELATELASPDAALHIGPQFVVLETAGTGPGREVAGTDRLQGVSSHVMFMARGKTGPFRTEGEAFPGTDGTVAVRLRLIDEGADDRADQRRVLLLPGRGIRWSCGSWWPASASATRWRSTTGPATRSASGSSSRPSARTVHSRFAAANPCAAGRPSPSSWAAEANPVATRRGARPRRQPLRRRVSDASCATT